MQKAFFFAKFLIFAGKLIEYYYEFSRNSWTTQCG